MLNKVRVKKGFKKTFENGQVQGLDKKGVKVTSVQRKTLKDLRKARRIIGAILT